jgi:hypothetical protein
VKGRLKVGLIVESLEVPRWVRHMVERISGSRFAVLELIVVLGRENGGTSEEAPGQPGVGRLYAALERRFLRVQEDALQEFELGELKGQARVLRVRPIDQRGTVHLPVDAVAMIRAEGLDVLFLVRPRRLGGDLLLAPRLGVWTCRHGAGRGAPGSLEVLQRNPVTESRLEVVTDGADEGPVLYRSYGSTHYWSVTKNANAAHWKAATIFPRMLEQMWSQGSEALSSTGTHIYMPPTPACGELSNGAAAGLILKTLLRRLLFTVQGLLWREQWLLLHATAGKGMPVLSRFQEMSPPHDRDWADPHLLVHSGKLYLFLEEAPFRTGKGHIAVMALDKQGRWSGPTMVLEKPYHLSNPFVFEWNGGIYMVPESAENRTVDLYRCEHFPDRWVHARTMLHDLQAVDATMFSHGDKYWMFMNVAETPGVSSCDELFLFHASDPVSGDWTPHPKNPIISDVRCARPAGALFFNNGAIIRPAQDCAERYGRAIRFMRVDRLTETDYAETQIGELRPDQGDKYLGVHTFDRAGSLSVIDAISKRLHFKL